MQNGESDVKKLIIAVALAVTSGACRSTSPSPATSPTPAPGARGNQTGALDGESAIRGFMDAVKQQDLQALGAFWGDAGGPARDAMGRTELEQREFVLLCYLKHDSFRILGDAPNPGGTRAFAVSLTKGPITRSTTVQVIRGPANRWYVKDVDVAKLGQDLCSSRG